MNVSSPPLKRNTMGAAGRRVACVRARTISSMMPTHDAQSAAPGEPSVVSKWPFTSTALPAVGSGFRAWGLRFGVWSLGFKDLEGLGSGARGTDSGFSV